VNHAGELTDLDRAKLIEGSFGTKHTFQIGLQRDDIIPEAPAPAAPAPQPQQQDAPPFPDDGDIPFAWVGPILALFGTLGATGMV